MAYLPFAAMAVVAPLLRLHAWGGRATNFPTTH